VHSHFIVNGANARDLPALERGEQLGERHVAIARRAGEVHPGARQDDDRKYGGNGSGAAGNRKSLHDSQTRADRAVAEDTWPVSLENS
jgi:hypothetical protein